MLPVRVQDHHGVGGVRERCLDAGGHGRALAAVGPHPDQPDALVAGQRLELGGQILRRAVVDEHHVVGVAQRPGDHVCHTVGVEHGDHRHEPLDRRQAGGASAVGSLRRSARASGTRPASPTAPIASSAR